MIASYPLRKSIRVLPGVVIKAVPIPDPEIINEYGSASKIGAVCKASGYKSVILITDSTLFSLGYHKVVADSVESEGIKCTIFSDISSEPTTDIVEKAREKALECEAECVIALGGGSVMDTCKMVASGMKLKHLSASALQLKFLFVPGGTSPMISIPTTAGTGAEMTVGAIVINSHTGAKTATVIVGLNVTHVILDAQFTVNAPAKVTAACGIDALSHGLEGCVASVHVSESDMFKSRECVRLVLENLPKVLANPKDIEARQAMALAANYGGNAINKQLAGYVHAFAHSIGAYYHIPHGVAIAMCLVPVFEAQKDFCPAEVNGWMERVEKLIWDSIPDLDGSIVQEKDFETIAHLVAVDSINYSAPTTFTKSEIIKILDDICHTQKKR